MEKSIGFDESILQLAPHPLARVPIARIVDTDLYEGTNPDETASRGIGLAEYSNANFLSEDTPFQSYPYPAWSSVDIEEREVEDPLIPGQRIWRQYYRKMRDGESNRVGDEVRGYLLAGVSFLRDFVLEQVPSFLSEYPNYEMPVLDSEVYRDYAQLLIPRAVGYSAGLLKYFFRGELDFSRSGRGSDGEIEITIRNLSREMLLEGVFELYYDNREGLRRPIELRPAAVRGLAEGGSFVTSFRPPEDFDSTKRGAYMLVYRGKLGTEQVHEEGAVIGRYKVLSEYRGCMVVYHKHMRRLFFMTHDEEGREKNFYIDLRGLIVPSVETANWSGADWRYWFWLRHNPLALSVLEYDAGRGALIYHDRGQGVLLKFRVTTPTEEYLDFNIGGEIMEEDLYGGSYGEATSYGNGSYGLGTKRFYRYEFDYEREKLPSVVDYGKINQGRLVLWEEDGGGGEFSSLQWDFTYTVSSDTGSWAYNNSLCWMTSSSPIPWRWGCLASYLGSSWHPEEWSLVGGMVTALREDFRGVGLRWWDWVETKGETWAEGPQYRHMHTHLGDPYNYGRLDAPESEVVDGGVWLGRQPLATGRLPHGGTETRMMGAFRRPGTTDGVTEHYRIDGRFYFGGMGAMPEELMDPRIYPFGPAIKELLVARGRLGLDHVPVVQIEEQNNFIGTSRWPMIWHSYLLRGMMRLGDGRTETVYGLVSSRQTEFFDNWATMEGTWWDAEGPLGDIRTLCDYGLIDVSRL
ncbi:MAG: hypothetical protein QW231_04780 [Candidatus Bathyarchaeia archaeon]